MLVSAGKIRFFFDQDDTLRAGCMLMEEALKKLPATGRRRQLLEELSRVPARDDRALQNL